MSKFFENAKKIHSHDAHTGFVFLIRCHEVFAAHFVCECISKRIIEDYQYTNMVKLSFIRRRDGQNMNIPFGTFIKFQRCVNGSVAISSSEVNSSFYSEIFEKDVCGKFYATKDSSNTQMRATVVVNILNEPMFLNIDIDIAMFESYSHLVLNSDNLTDSQKRVFWQSALAFKKYLNGKYL